jgi:hypothetical protein
MEGFRVDESPMIAEYRRQLAATLAWCEPRFDPARAADSLRSTELGPPRNIVHERTHVDLIAAEVAAVLARRQERLGSKPAPATALPPGDRILAFLPRRSLFHGSSPPECDGQDGWINDGEWQTEPYLGDRHTDHVIRVPVPRRSPAESGGDASAAPADVVD